MEQLNSCLTFCTLQDTLLDGACSKSIYCGECYQRIKRRSLRSTPGNIIFTISLINHLKFLMSAMALLHVLSARLCVRLASASPDSAHQWWRKLRDLLLWYAFRRSVQLDDMCGVLRHGLVRHTGHASNAVAPGETSYRYCCIDYSTV